MLALSLQTRHWTTQSDWRTGFPASRIFPESKASRRYILTRETMFSMKKITSVFLTVCVALAGGCRWGGVRGNGHIKMNDRTMSAIREIDDGGAFEIEWQRGAHPLRLT